MGTNSRQLEVEQLCDDPGCTCSWLMDPTQGGGQLSSLPGSTTWPPLNSLQKSLLPGTCVKHKLSVQLSAVVSQNHSCRTQKKQRNQAPGIPHDHNHVVEASSQHSLFPLPIPSAFTRSLSVTAIPHQSSQAAVTGMPEEMR